MSKMQVSFVNEVPAFDWAAQGDLKDYKHALP